jgi:hypothetical protein
MNVFDDLWSIGKGKGGEDKMVKRGATKNIQVLQLGTHGLIEAESADRWTPSTEACTSSSAPTGRPAVRTGECNGSVFPPAGSGQGSEEGMEIG